MSATVTHTSVSRDHTLTSRIGDNLELVRHLSRQIFPSLVLTNNFENKLLNKDITCNDIYPERGTAE